jgi:aryl-phospho-beta-D-glucosidase BglC (GH1 family)
MTWYGFNFLWMFIWDDGFVPEPADGRALDFLARHRFNFVRVPTDYRHWTRDFNYADADEHVLAVIDGYLDACRARGLHMSLNGHCVPGYCINRNDLERHNLWRDAVAQDAFVLQWERFARRYKGIPGSVLSFDLVNEPPMVGQYGCTREIHERLIRRTVSAIRAIDPDRAIVIDGLGCGHLALPELADAGVTHSGRGYQPMPVSHHQAPWVDGWERMPAPAYPGQVWDGVTWNRDSLRDFYQPWRDVAARGVDVHIGEFGCFNRTPNDVALRWLGDLTSLYREFGWGWALWNFDGAFGVVDHGRPGARWELLDGYRVDRDLLELLRP